MPRVLLATGLADGYVRVPGPLGDLFVAFSPNGVSWIAPAGDEAEFEAAFRRHVGRDIVPVPTFPPKWQRALDRAFKRVGSGSLPVDLRSVSPFQAEVLRAITAIPPGEVRPYAWVARQVGRPGAVRAVGTAMARNPVPVVVPCHRVIRSDGTVGNYAYGPEMKRALLRQRVSTWPRWRPKPSPVGVSPGATPPISTATPAATTPAVSPTSTASGSTTPPKPPRLDIGPARNVSHWRRLLSSRLRRQTADGRKGEGCPRGVLSQGGNDGGSHLAVRKGVERSPQGVRELPLPAAPRRFVPCGWDRKNGATGFLSSGSGGWFTPEGAIAADWLPSAVCRLPTRVLPLTGEFAEILQWCTQVIVYEATEHRQE